MLFNVIFLILFLAAWGAVGMLVWIGLSLRRRAVGALWAAPFALIGAIGGGILTGVIGWDVGWSFAVAASASAVCCLLAFRTWDAWNLGERFASWARLDRPR